MEKLYQHIDKSTLMELFGYSDTNGSGALDPGDIFAYAFPARSYKGDIVEKSKTVTRTVRDEYLQSTESFETFLSDLTQRRVQFLEVASSLNGQRVYLALSHMRPAVKGLADLYRLDVSPCPESKCPSGRNIVRNAKDEKLPFIENSRRKVRERSSCEEYICELYLEKVWINFAIPSSWLSISIYDYDRCLERYPEK